MELGHMSDDCLMEVLECLAPADILKMTQMNQQLNRLSEIKLGLKVKKVMMDDRNTWYAMADCKHEEVAYRQVLDLDLMMKRATNPSKAFHAPSIRATFYNTMKRFPNVTSVDFGTQELSDSVLKKVSQICPKIECLIVKYSSVTVKGWRQFFSILGHQVVHIAWILTTSKHDPSVTIEVLNIIASMCPNLKQANIKIKYLTQEFINLLKKLPTSCFIVVGVPTLDRSLDDTVDRISCANIDFSVFGNRTERLSELAFDNITNGQDGQLNNIEFTNLKKLWHYPEKVILQPDYNFLADFRYPRLEMLHMKAILFNTTEDTYELLFQSMPELTTLRFDYNIYSTELHDATITYDPHLPKESVLVLTKLKEIKITLNCFTDTNNWSIDEFIQRLNWYVNQVQSLKKITIDAEENEMQLVEGDLNALRVNQDRVEIIAELF